LTLRQPSTGVDRFIALLLTTGVDASTSSDTMDTTTVADRIKYLGSCVGSLRRLDKAAGLHPGHVHALANRITDPHTSTLQKVADGAGVSCGWLANGEGALPDPEEVRAAVDRAVGSAADADREADEPDPSEAA